MKKLLLLVTSALLAAAGAAHAAPEQYVIDKGHTFVTFTISHIGFGTEFGNFNRFDGSLSYDPENPAASKVEFTVDVPSIDTNHAERDKHLKSDDFFYADRYPVAKFVSTSYEKTGEDTAVLHGKLTIRGVTKDIDIPVQEMAAREDPWGNFRRAWTGEFDVTLKDFGMDYDLGPASRQAHVKFSLEAVRK